MSKILLDYVFPISVITPTPAASTAFLKQACLVVKPKAGKEGDVGKVFNCTNISEVLELTNNENARQLFAGGLSRVFIMLSNNLDLVNALELSYGKFYTLIISDDFNDSDINGSPATDAVKASVTTSDYTFEAVQAGESGNDITLSIVLDEEALIEAVVAVDVADITVTISPLATKTNVIEAINAHAEANLLVVASTTEGADEALELETQLTNGSDATPEIEAMDVTGFNGVVGVSLLSEAIASAQAAIEKRCAFIRGATTGAKNLCYAFGSLLGNMLNWSNQQYITMPFTDDIEDLGQANNLFDEKVSFVISDEEFGNRLALFACGGRAIVAPYILKNLCIDLQSKSLQWISANQPSYTLVQASLLESRLQEDVIDSYINRLLITEGQVLIKLEQDDFVASGYITVPTPKAMWRVVSELRQTI